MITIENYNNRGRMNYERDEIIARNIKNNPIA